MAESVIIPNNCGIATFLWTFIPAGKQFSATMGYLDNVSSDNPENVADKFRTEMVSAGRPAAAASMTTDWRFEGVSVLQRLSTGVLQVGQNLSPVPGTVASTTALSPVFSTWVVSKNTAFAGRQYRGRMYPPMTALNENGVDWNGTIVAGSVIAEQAKWTGFLDAMTPGDITIPMILHTIPDNLITPLPTRITSLLVRPVVGIQRRRRAKGA